MRIFNSDLDNTLIYSYKHEIGRDKRCVEVYQGREISYMTEFAYEHLKEVNRRYLFVPTTTRTIEQYQRIRFGSAAPEYALVCNGGVLLEHGISNQAWYEKSLELASEAQAELKKAVRLLECDGDVCFEVRYIQELFVFTKSGKPESTIQRLRCALDTEKVDVFQNGVKVYVMPKRLDKGTAVRRFRLKTGAETVIAAGDSLFDLPMLQAADEALLPEALFPQLGAGKNVTVVREGSLLSDEVIKYLLQEESMIQWLK